MITIMDANSQRKGSAEARIRIEDFRAKQLALNGIRLMKMYEDKYWPWPQKKYGEGNGDIYFFYQYFSAPGGDDSVKAQYILKRREKGAAPLAWTEVLPKSGVRPVMAHIPAESLMTGSYQLTVRIQDAADTVETADSIYVHNIRIISVKEYLEQIDQLEYIARGRELDSLKKATPAERESLLTVFWQIRDPDTTTSRNEYRDVYYDRVSYANEHFGSPFKPGWKSDMGLVYILYGQADDIERHPFDIATPPYETWYYYSVGLKFVFMDSKGIGDYELISPRRERIK
jgi:GWxTD domain-containing protein